MNRRSIDIAVRLGSEGLVRLCGLAAMTLLIHSSSIGPSGYGLLNGFGSLAGFFSIIGSLGLSYHVGRIIGRGETVAARRLVRRLLLLAGLGGLLLGMAAIGLSHSLNAWFLKHPDGALAIAFGSGTIIAGSIEGIQQGWLQLRDRFRSMSALQAGSAVAQLVGIVLVDRAGGGPAAVLAVFSGISFARIAAGMLILRYTPRAIDVVRDDRLPDLRQCLADGWTLILGALGTWGLGKAGGLVLGNATEIGKFAAPAALASIPSAVGSACSLPLYAALMRAVAAGSRHRTFAAIRHYASDYHRLTIPAVVIAMVLAGDAVHLLGGKEFAGLGPIAILLLASGWIELAILPLTYLLVAHGWASRSRNATLASALISVTATIIAVRVLDFGPVGVALGMISGQFGIIALSAWGLRHARCPWSALIPGHPRRVVAAAVASGAVAWTIPHADWPGLIIAGVASTGTAGAVLARTWGKRPRAAPATTD